LCANALGNSTMLVVGLTGNIGSGKSTVARALEARGVPVIDADLLAREAVAPGSPGLAAIAARFGPAVVDAGGALDRAALRKIVFSNAAERAALDSIVHPAVKTRRDVLLAEQQQRGSAVVVCDIPLLFETKLDREVDVILLVDAPRDVRLERIEHNRRLPRAEALAMLDAQQPAEEKRARADYIIDNDGTVEALRARIDETWKRLLLEHLG
jgi:dephospho-CoA kinase